MNYRIAFFPILAFTAIGFGSAPYLLNSYQQNDWFAEFGENTAAYVNPASISEADQFEVGTAVYRTLSGQAGQEFITAVQPLGYDHTIGLTYFDNGSQIEGSNASYLENAYSLSYALRMPSTFPNRISHKLALGVNATVFQYDPFGAFGGIQYSFGGDLGLSYNPFSSSRYGDLLIGLALQNALQPSVKTTDGGNYSLPMNLNTSLFWRGLDRKLELAGSYSMLDLTGNGGNSFSARATYYIAPWVGLKLKYSKEGYPVFGATANVQRLNLFRYLQFDLDMSHDALSTDNEQRGFIWNFKVIARLGATREDQFGESRYQKLKVEPEEAYREGMRLYLARQYLAAAYQFGKVVSKYPTFQLVDQAALYKGKSFENLNMHKAATDVYEEAMRKYADSDQRPKYMFQLMNIDYKDGKYADASRLHQQLINLYPDADAKPDADYVMGQIKYIQKDYDKAIALLSSIPAGNANYPYARYTLGVCYANIKKMNEAEAAFKDVYSIKPSNSSEQEMKDVAAVKLGDINFDKPQLKQAAEYYASVSSTSPQYDQALLGLAWAFLKEKTFKGTVDYSNAIITKTPNSLLVPEAHLLLGYCAYFDKNFDLAIAEFNKAIDASNKKAAEIQDRKQKQSANATSSDEFVAVEDQAFELASELPTEHVVAKQQDLKPKFDAVYAKVSEQLEYQRESEQLEKFLANRDKVLKDANFTKATINTLKAGSGNKQVPSQQDLKGLDVQ